MGIENVDSKTPEQAMLALCTHLAELQNLEQLRGAHFVLIPESNLANAGANLQLNLRNSINPSVSAGISSTDIISEEEKMLKLISNLRSRISFMSGVASPGKVGVWITNSLKSEMATSLSVRLKNGLLVFHRNLICAASGQNFKSVDAKKEMLRQLRSYERQIVLNSDGELRNEFYSGKRTGPDDLIIALQILNLYSKLYLKSPERYASKPF